MRVCFALVLTFARTTHTTVKFLPFCFHLNKAQPKTKIDACAGSVKTGTLGLLQIERAFASVNATYGALLVFCHFYFNKAQSTTKIDACAGSGETGTLGLLQI